MRPDCIGLTAVGFSETCVEYVDVVDKTVSVAVVLCEVNLVVEYLACVDDHQVGILVISPVIVLSVICHVVRKCHRTVKIEYRAELRVSLFVGGVGVEPVAA